jgi:hypothetical protein
MTFSNSWDIRPCSDPVPEEMEIVGIASPDWAYRFLLGFRGDSFRMAGFRRLLGEANLASLPGRSDDSEVLRLLGSEIASGRFRVVQKKPPVYTGTVAKTDEASDTPANVPVRRPPPPASVPPAAFEEPTFPISADPVAIAAAQQEAAMLGVPFCEECQKKALANAS